MTYTFSVIKLQLTSHPGEKISCPYRESTVYVKAKNL